MKCRSGSLGNDGEVVYSCEYEAGNCCCNWRRYGARCAWIDESDDAGYGRTSWGAGFFCLHLYRNCMRAVSLIIDWGEKCADNRALR